MSFSLPFTSSWTNDSFVDKVVNIPESDMSMEEAAWFGDDREVDGVDFSTDKYLCC